VSIKNLTEGEQTTVAIESLADWART
jgi:hypothetical protein